MSGTLSRDHSSYRQRRWLTALLLFAGMSIPFFSASAETPPVNPDQLFDWLKAENYKSWSHESEPHKSAGPHPSSVIAYLNPVLDQSLAAGASAHPKGAAAVKELFNPSGELNGWAVSVKTEEDSKAGDGWFWYEILGTSPDSRIVAADNGVPLCFGCHTPGRDFILIPHPLK